MDIVAGMLRLCWRAACLGSLHCKEPGSLRETKDGNAPHAALASMGYDCRPLAVHGFRSILQHGTEHLHLHPSVHYYWLKAPPSCFQEAVAPSPP